MPFLPSHCLVYIPSFFDPFIIPSLHFFTTCSLSILFPSPFPLLFIHNSSTMADPSHSIKSCVYSHSLVLGTRCWKSLPTVDGYPKGIVFSLGWVDLSWVTYHLHIYKYICCLDLIQLSTTGKRRDWI